MGSFSCYTGRRIFSTLSITGSLVRRWIDAACPGHSVDAAASHGRRGCIVPGQQPGNAPEISEGSTFSNLREVIMTMSEYEERFRPPAPSLHQTFAEVRGPNRGGSRSRRLWVSAALVGVMTITSKAALHHRYPRARGVHEWRSSRRGEPLPACRALFSRYERCFRRAPAPGHPPNRAGRSRNGDGGGGRVRDDWSGAHRIKR